MSYNISFSEFKVDKSTQNNAINYHPLNILYYMHNSQQLLGGNLSFAGFNLNKTHLFDDVHAIWVEFSGEVPMDRESWADAFRGIILRKTGIFTHKEWCVNVKGDISNPSGEPNSYVSLNEHIKSNFIDRYDLNSALISMPLPYRSGESEKRLIVQYPNHLIAKVVERYWGYAYPGAPIEGYLLPSDGMEKIKYWETQKRDENLFRNVVDECEMLFITQPSEHRHFVFLTNKYDLKAFYEMVDGESLKLLRRESEN